MLLCFVVVWYRLFTYILQGYFTVNQTIKSMAQCTTAVTPVLMHWSYCSFALSCWYGHISRIYCTWHKTDLFQMQCLPNTCWCLRQSRNNLKEKWKSYQSKLSPIVYFYEKCNGLNLKTNSFITEIMITTAKFFVCLSRSICQKKKIAFSVTPQPWDRVGGSSWRTKSQRPICPALSIPSYLLMIWWCKEPRYKQQWY